MFGLGATEVIVILALALIVLGPQKLPELAKNLARMLGDLRRVADDVRSNFEEATREPTKHFNELMAAARDQPQKPADNTPTPPAVAADGSAGNPQPDTVAAPPPVVAPTPVFDPKAFKPIGDAPASIERAAHGVSSSSSSNATASGGTDAQPKAPEGTVAATPGRKDG